MELGAFPISLAVKDLDASRSFCEKLGFGVVTGDAAQNWLIMKNGDHAIGLFQGMFEKNILTFTPADPGRADLRRGVGEPWSGCPSRQLSVRREPREPCNTRAAQFSR